MKKLEWNVQYSTGIPAIDRQHAFLFELANRVIAGAHRPHSAADMEAILRDLEGYAEKHFTYEESVLESAGYEHTQEHCALHENMRKRLKALRNLLADNTLTPGELANFLEEWLTIHILREDMKYLPTVARWNSDLENPR